MIQSRTVTDKWALLSEINLGISGCVNAIADHVANSGPFPLEHLERVCIALEAGRHWLDQYGGQVPDDPTVEQQLATYRANLARLQTGLDQFQLTALAQMSGLHHEPTLGQCARAAKK